MSEFVDRSDTRLHWTLRTGAALCFLGHGAFGLIGKSAWVAYFGVVGIAPGLAYQLMPLVGATDILLAALILLQPRPAFLAYMVGWATWTALLRPLAHEPFWEALERAGNYGVPLALLLTQSPPFRWWGRLQVGSLNEDRRRRLEPVLVWTTVLLLVGHGALALSGKAELVRHYALLDSNRAFAICRASGLVELILALAIARVRAPALALTIVAWKLATESLFLFAGAPVWEVVERAGSYAAPLALAVLLSGLSEDSRPLPAVPE